MNKNIHTRVLAAREAGAVERCHALPHHGQYNVAMHSYNMASMLFILHPGPSLELIKAALWHDAGERWVGDVPAPAKWFGNGLLHQMLDEAELQVREHWGLDFDLNEEDQWWLKGVDYLEFYMWTNEQKAMGNRNLDIPREAIWKFFEFNKEKIPGPVWTVFRSGHRRLEDNVWSTTTSAS